LRRCIAVAAGSPSREFSPGTTTPLGLAIQPKDQVDRCQPAYSRVAPTRLDQVRLFEDGQTTSPGCDDEQFSILVNIQD